MLRHDPFDDTSSLLCTLHLAVFEERREECRRAGHVPQWALAEVCALDSHRLVKQLDGRRRRPAQLNEDLGPIGHLTAQE